MAFFKKKVELSTITQADISVKKSIDKLGGIANSPKTMVPIFIALDKAIEGFGSKDPKLTSVIIFGPKVKAMKPLILPIIAKYKAFATYGFAHVEYDDKKVPTLVISPEKGDGHKKEALLQKAMKLQFGTTYSNFKIGAEVDAKQAEALEAAAEALPDDVEDAPNTVESAKDLIGKAQEKVDATAKPKTQEEALTNVIAHVTGLMETLKKLQAENADQAQLTAAASAVEKALVGAQTGKIV
jgi:hypothetical protein